MILGFQGEPGAFSEDAAIASFGAVETRGFAAFDELLEAVAAGRVDRALLPVENTISGRVAAACDALAARPQLRVAGEVTHAVEQCLIGVRGASAHGLTRVRSHPVALAQCRAFFGRNPQIYAEATGDTAGAVREIATLRVVSIGAIGPAGAAERYGCVVVRRGIQDAPESRTRFAIIERAGSPRASSVRFACTS